MFGFWVDDFWLDFPVRNYRLNFFGREFSDFLVTGGQGMSEGDRGGVEGMMKVKKGG